MNTQICDLLNSLGITANYTGYYYAAYAVELVADDPSRLILVTKDLYPTVGVHFSTTASCVERNIRHVTDLAWRTNPQLLQQMAGYHLCRRPCASRFIAILSSEYKKLPKRRISGVQQTFF